MPTKGSSLLTGDRKPTLSRKLHRLFDKDHKDLNISYKDYKNIVDTVNEIKGEYILQPTGYKLEYGGSVIIVNKYKSKKLLCDYNATRKYGKYIPYINDHSHNYKHVIKWYSTFDRYKAFKLMVFFPIRPLKRKLAQIIKKNEVVYQNWTRSDFYAVKHLQKLLN